MTVEGSNGHINLTVMMGPSGDIPFLLWTMKGKRMTRDRLEGTTRSYVNLTDNGWSDDTSWVLAITLLVEHMKKKGLKKLLLLVDNAAVHYNWPALELMKKNNIHMFGLIPQATGFMQPLDVGFFDAVSRGLDGLPAGTLTVDNLAHNVEKVITKMEENAGHNVGVRGFKKAGLWPPNEHAHPDTAFAVSDHLVGLSADHPAVKDYVAPSYDELVSNFHDVRKEMDPKLAADVAKLAADDAKTGKFDPTRLLYTSDSWLAEHAAKKLRKEEDDAAAVAKREEKKAAREAKAAQKAAEKAEKEKAKQEEKAAKEKAAAEAEERRAAAAAAKAAQLKAARAASRAGGKAAAQGNPYAPVYLTGKKRKFSEVSA